MKKMLLGIAILLMPCLAFAKGECQRLTDEQYRQKLISQPQVIPYHEDDRIGTLIITYDKNGTGKGNLNFKCYFGVGEFDYEFTWSVNNAILHTHTTSAKHNDAHNKRLNEELDCWVRGEMSDPDNDQPLDTCGQKQFSKEFNR